MRKARRITKNTMLLICANVINSLMAFVLIVTMARVLGDVTFGKYSFALSFVGFFTVVADLGLGVWLTREIARYKKKASSLLSNVIALRGLLSVLSLILIYIVINLLGYPADTLSIVYLVGLYSVVESFSTIYRSVFKAHEKMEYDALVQVFYRFVTVCLGLLVLYLGLGIVPLLSVFLLSSLLYVLFTFSLGGWKFASPSFSIDFNLWKKMLKQSLPFAITGLLVTLYFKIDVVMLSMMKGDEVVGWYGAAYTMIYALVFVPYSFSESIFPQMSQAFRKSKKELQRLYSNSLRFMVLLAVPMMVGTTLLASDFVFLIYGEEYLGAVVAVQLLSWALGILFINHVLSTTLNSVDKQHMHTWIALFCAVFNIALNFYLIPLYGIAGASVSTIATEFLIMAFLFVYLRRFVKASLLILVRPCLAAVIMGFFVYYSPLYFLFTMVIGVILYFIVLFLLGGITKKDFALFRSFLGN